MAAKQTDYPPDLEDVAIALSDVDLVGRVYQVVDVLDDDPGANELYFLLTEAFERWAPDAEWADVERRIRASYDPRHRLLGDELLDCHRARRRCEAARLLHRELDVAKAAGDG